MVGLYSLRETSEYVHHALQSRCGDLDFFVNIKNFIEAHIMHTCMFRNVSGICLVRSNGNMLVCVKI